MRVCVQFNTSELIEIIDITSTACGILFTLESSCPEECRCTSGGADDGGKDVNDAGYCNHFCSKWGYCGEGVEYEKGDSIDCTGCSSGNCLPGIYFTYTFYKNSTNV